MQPHGKKPQHSNLSDVEAKITIDVMVLVPCYHNGIGHPKYTRGIYMSNSKAGILSAHILLFDFSQEFS